MSRKRMIAVAVGIIIIVSLMFAVAYFSGITGKTITSSIIVSKIGEEVSTDLEGGDDVQDFFEQG